MHTLNCAVFKPVVHTQPECDCGTAQAFLAFGVREKHESWCALMIAQMGEEVDTATGTVSVSPEKNTHIQICHTCDNYPCACNQLLNGVPVQSSLDWIYKINGKKVSLAEYEAFHNRKILDGDTEHWSTSKQLDEVISVREGKVIL